MPTDPTLTSARQIVDRDILQQVFPNIPSQLLDLLLRSIDKDLTVPLRVDASPSANLVVSVGPAIVNNSISGRQKSIPHINNAIPVFTSGTVTFPSTNGGTITVSPGSNVTLTCPSNNYVKILISLDSTGNLVITQGTANAVEASALVPFPVVNCLPIAYVSLFNNAGTIQNITQNKIFQFGGGGGSGGAALAGPAQNVPLSIDTVTVTVTFPMSQPGVNYVPIVQLVNLVDAFPQFQTVTVTNKTNLGFTAQWNAPLDSGNYSLDYIVPVVQAQIGEVSIPASVTTITVDIPIELVGTDYTVVAQLVNYVDGFPQFQPVTITAKTDTTFTAQWNAETDSANYKLAFNLAQYQ